MDGKDSQGLGHISSIARLATEGTRKNSLFFKTEHGATVGDILASLIQTCHLNEINAWDYLVTLIRHKADARRNPHLYLPWNYKGQDEGVRAA